MFKEAGLATPMELSDQGQWSWDTYLDVALQLSKGGGTEKVFGTPSYAVNAWRYVFVHSNGGRILNEDRSQCVISMPETMQALQFQFDILHKHKAAPLPEESEVLGGVRQAFMAQRLAMTVDGIWSATSFRQIEDFDWAVAPIPISPNSGYARTNYKPNADSMQANILEEHKDAAWRWLSFDPIGQNRLNIDAGSSLAPFTENLDYFYEHTPVRNPHVVYQHFENEEVTYLPLNTTWFEWEKVIMDELGLVNNLEKTLEEAVVAIEPRVNQILAAAADKS
jgi:multiple sugar transport system substrate-binding protein